MSGEGISDMRIAIGLLLAVAALGSLSNGCGSDPGALELRILFASVQARDATKKIRVVVIVPAEDSRCSFLQFGTKDPGDPGYEIDGGTDGATVFDYPDGEPGKLKNIGPGPRLFFAEALNDAAEVAYNGCVRQEETGKDGPAFVTIVLD